MQKELNKDDERVQAEAAATRAYNQLLKDLAAEQRAKGKSTEFGKLARYTRPKADLTGSLASFFNNPIIQGIAISQAIDNVKEMLAATTAFAQALFVKDHIVQRPYVSVADTLDDALSVEFAQVTVSEDVAKRLEQEIDLVRMQDSILAQRFEKSGFMGPFIEEKSRYGLMREFQLRQEPETDYHQSKTYAHCVSRVAQLQEDLAYDIKTGPCTVRVFGVVAAGPQGGRKYDTKAAEYGQEMTASNISNVLSQYEGPRVPSP